MQKVRKSKKPIARSKDPRGKREGKRPGKPKPGEGAFLKAGLDFAAEVLALAVAIERVSTARHEPAEDDDGSTVSEGVFASRVGQILSTRELRDLYSTEEEMDSVRVALLSEFNWCVNRMLDGFGDRGRRWLVKNRIDSRLPFVKRSEGQRMITFEERGGRPIGGDILGVRAFEGNVLGAKGAREIVARSVGLANESCLRSIEKTTGMGIAEVDPRLLKRGV